METQRMWWSSWMLGVTFLRTIPPESSLIPIPRWVPVARKDEIVPGRLLERCVQNEPYVLYLDESVSPAVLSAIYGVCPHQAARFRVGSLDRTTGCVSCGYHGFTFRSGQLVGFKPGASRLTPQPISVPRLNVCTDKDLVYISSNHNNSLDVFQPPEENDASFVDFSGQVTIRQGIDVVTENVLDMLHVSQVHYFGNRDEPLPSSIQFTSLGPWSGRTTYKYKSGPNSLSRLLGRVDTVVVENEYHLPSTTVTRVTAGSLVKTVVTRSCPVEPDKTTLYYKLYRNFWTSNVVERWVGTWFLHQLMRQTLAEDVAILRHVDGHRRLGGFLTKYDETIKRFREASQRSDESS